ncbi:hypothetical protein BLX88_02665, partial [Bacillus obstructivus]
RETARTLIDLADAVFQRGHHVGPLELEGRQRVLERQHRQDFAHGHIPGIDGCAQAAAIDDGDGHAPVLDPVEHGVGDEIAHGAFDHPANLAGRFDDAAGFGHLFGFQGFDGLGQFLDPREIGGIRHHGGIEQDR